MARSSFNGVKEVTSWWTTYCQQIDLLYGSCCCGGGREDKKQANTHMKLARFCINFRCFPFSPKNLKIMLHSTQVSLRSQSVAMETWPPPPHGLSCSGVPPLPITCCHPSSVGGQCWWPLVIHAFPTWPIRLLYITCWLHSLLSL